jgi:hypothetical protein
MGGTGEGRRDVEERRRPVRLEFGVARGGGEAQIEAGPRARAPFDLDAEEVAGMVPKLVEWIVSELMSSMMCCVVEASEVVAVRSAIARPLLTAAEIDENAVSGFGDPSGGEDEPPKELEPPISNGAVKTFVPFRLLPVEGAAKAAVPVRNLPPCCCCCCCCSRIASRVPAGRDDGVRWK